MFKFRFTTNISLKNTTTHQKIGWEIVRLPFSMTYQKPDDHTVVSYAAKKCFLYTSIKNMTEMRPLIPLLIDRIILMIHALEVI